MGYTAQKAKKFNHLRGQASCLAPDGRTADIRDLHPEEWTDDGFRLFLRASKVSQRERLYLALIRAVKLNQVCATNLLKIVRFEPNLKLVQRATRDYLNYRSCAVLDEFRGVYEIVELFENDQLKNPGAVLAGMLSMGDRRINVVVRILRNRLSVSQIQEFSRIHQPQLHAPTVEFYIDWLFELQLKKDTRKFNLVCSAFKLMVLHDETGYVSDQADDSQIGLRPSRPLNLVRFEDYLRRLESSFESLGLLTDCQSWQHAMMRAWRDHAPEAVALRSAKSVDQGH